MEEKTRLQDELRDIYADLENVRRELAEKTTVIERLSVAKQALEEEREGLKKDLHTIKQTFNKTQDAEQKLR